MATERVREGFGRLPTGVAVAVLLAACGTWTAAWAGRDDEPVAVRGRVSDEEGGVVPGHAVRLLKSRKILSLGSFSSRDQSVEQVRAETDGHGFFEFRFPVDPQFRYYYLRFYDPASFDAVKYRLPEDREISRKVRQGRDVQVSAVLKLHPGWPEVKATIDQYGSASQCGQVLRALGLPTRRIPQDEGRELWEYDPAGVSYLVESGRVLSTRRTGAAQTPVLDDGTKDRPVGAERVDEP